mmetsp:Transcript_31274/g.104496  ORF Transcript_31274/g.104496 Transcript_31274/m.104496 type:complete len:226 (+) Transcript_31274:165-842(+)
MPVATRGLSSLPAGNQSSCLSLSFFFFFFFFSDLSFLCFFLCFFSPSSRLSTAAAAALANSMASLSLAAPTASLPMGGNGMGNSMHNSMSMAMGGLASDSYSGYSNGSFTGSGKAGPDTATTLPGLGAFASNNNGAPNGHSGVVKQGSAVLVSDLPPHFSPSDLQTAFSRFGTITFCELETGSSSGRVGFDSPLSALHAASTMNGAALGDSTLQVVGLPYLPASA